jgi:NAD-dependent SIR2 family protein deacetylase
MSEIDATNLSRFIRNHPQLTILSGAGCSTASGIPDYRDDLGKWKHRQPMQFSDFVADAGNRRRYWAQSFAGWSRIARAKPNRAHLAIARLEQLGFVTCVVTQNVDDLHTTAGSQRVIDLHGILRKIRCLKCDSTESRKKFQQKLRDANPDWDASISTVAPDGDAKLFREDFEYFNVPDCTLCGGILKPDVVFFGEPVPAERVANAQQYLQQSDALLVVGSSLMVFSGYRFARSAGENGKPIAIVNRGTTRADDLATCKMTGDCADVLSQTVEILAA